MNIRENQQCLMIMEKFMQHPIVKFTESHVQNYQTSKNSRVMKLHFRTFTSVYESLKDNKYKSQQEWVDQVFKVIKKLTFSSYAQPTDKDNDFIKIASDEIKRIFEKELRKSDINTIRDWGKILGYKKESLMTALRSAPKVFCLPQTSLMKKPDVPMITIKDIEKMSKRIKEIKSSDELHKIYRIIKRDEPSIVLNETENNTINLNDLKTSTLVHLKHAIRKSSK